MRAARLIELICGIAAGGWGLLMLAFFLFGPSYTGGSSESCTSSPDGTTVCTTYSETNTQVSALGMGLDPMAKFWLSGMAIVLGAIAVSAMLHSQTGNTALRALLVASTCLLLLLTCLSIASIGLTLLPSLALAIGASAAAFQTERRAGTA